MSDESAPPFLTHHSSLIAHHYWAVALVAGSLVLALLPLKLAALVVAGALVVGLGLARPAWSVYFLAFAVPFGSAAELGLGTLPFGAVEALVALLIAGWAAGTAARGEFRPRIAAPVFGGAVFAAALLATSPQGPSMPVAAREVLKWVELVAVLLIFSDRAGAIRPARHPRHSSLVTRHSFGDRAGAVRPARLLIAIFLAASLEAAIGWYQFFFRVGPESFELGRFLRAYGTFGQPNPFAGYLVTVVVLAYAVVLGVGGWGIGVRDRRSRARLGPQPPTPIPYPLFVAAGLVLLLGLPAIAMSLSRGAWLGLAAAMLLVTALAHRRAAVALLAVLGLVAVSAGLGVFALLPTTIAERLDAVFANLAVFDPRGVVVTDENWAIVERMANWHGAWDMFRAAPIWGHGTGSFELVYSRFALHGWDQIPAIHAHNYYLNLLAESGVVGLAGHLVFLTTAFGYVITVIGRCRPAAPFANARLDREPGDRTNRLRRAVGLGVLGALIGVTVQNVFDMLYVHGLTVHLALLLGLPLLAERLVDLDDPARAAR